MGAALLARVLACCVLCAASAHAAALSADELKRMALAATYLTAPAKDNVMKLATDPKADGVWHAVAVWDQAPAATARTHARWWRQRMCVCVCL
jgi:hypothetical protein